MKHSLFWTVSRAICRLVTTLLFDLKVYGRKHIPRSGGLLVVSNHQSYLDPVLLGVQLDRPMNYLARSGLFKNPLFGWLIRSLNAVPIRQGESDIGALKQTIQRLQEGHMLNIYPEGERTGTGEIGSAQPGVALVVRRAKVPVVPAAICGSFEAWPKWKKMFRPHPIRVKYGPPMLLHDRKSDEIVQIVDREIRRLFDELRQQMREEGVCVKQP